MNYVMYHHPLLQEDNLLNSNSYVIMYFIYFVCLKFLKSLWPTGSWTYMIFIYLQSLFTTWKVYSYGPEFFFFKPYFNY